MVGHVFQRMLKHYFILANDHGIHFSLLKETIAINESSTGAACNESAKTFW